VRREEPRQPTDCGACSQRKKPVAASNPRRKGPPQTAIWASPNRYRSPATMSAGGQPVAIEVAQASGFSGISGGGLRLTLLRRGSRAGSRCRTATTAQIPARPAFCSSWLGPFKSDNPHNRPSRGPVIAAASGSARRAVFRRRNGLGAPGSSGARSSAANLGVGLAVRILGVHLDVEAGPQAGQLRCNTRRNRPSHEFQPSSELVRLMDGDSPQARLAAWQGFSRGKCPPTPTKPTPSTVIRPPAPPAAKADQTRGVDPQQWPQPARRVSAGHGDSSAERGAEPSPGSPGVPGERQLPGNFSGSWGGILQARFQPPGR